MKEYIFSLPLIHVKQLIGNLHKMKKLILFALLAGIMSSCAEDTGKTQAALQNIYSAISDGNLNEANAKLASTNQLNESPLVSDGYTKELYGQVHVMETYPIGTEDELIIYKLEKHERNRMMQRKLDSDEFKKKKAAGQIKSIDEENGIIVYSERKYAFKVMEEGDAKYVIRPTSKDMNAHFSKNKDKVQALVRKHF